MIEQRGRRMHGKVLFWQWNSFMVKGVEQAFHKLNIWYSTYYRCVQNWDDDGDFAQELEEKLQKDVYTTVFSINFCPIIAEVCENNHIHYVAWVYDSPMNIRKLKTMNLSYTSVWIFDRGIVDEYNRWGYRCQHLPLAVSPDIFKKNIGTWKNMNEISFVGKIYRTDYAKYLSFLPEYRRGYLNGLLAAQGKLYGAYLFGDILTEDFLTDINLEFAKTSDGQLQMEKEQLEFLLASEVTSRERKTLLKLLAAHYQLDVYSEETQVLEKTRGHGYIDYYTQMPEVFANSKVNLNISLKAIRTGIPLRVIDVMGCGGFVLSNYQEEILEYMHPGVDCEVYESLEDAYYKVEFYLKNEKIREKIARNGLELVTRDFSFEDRVKVLLEL